MQDTGGRMAHVNLLKRLYEAFVRGESQTVLGMMSPDIQYLGTGKFQGVMGARQRAVRFANSHIEGGPDGRPANSRSGKGRRRRAARLRLDSCRRDLQVAHHRSAAFAGDGG